MIFGGFGMSDIVNLENANGDISFIDDNNNGTFEKDFDTVLSGTITDSLSSQETSVTNQDGNLVTQDDAQLDYMLDALDLFF
jgi:hypothetical protein